MRIVRTVDPHVELTDDDDVRGGTISMASGYAAPKTRRQVVEQSLAYSTTGTAQQPLALTPPNTAVIADDCVADISDLVATERYPR